MRRNIHVIYATQKSAWFWACRLRCEAIGPAWLVVSTGPTAEKQLMRPSDYRDDLHRVKKKELHQNTLLMPFVKGLVITSRYLGIM